MEIHDFRHFHDFQKLGVVSNRRPSAKIHFENRPQRKLFSGELKNYILHEIAISLINFPLVLVKMHLSIILLFFPYVLCVFHSTVFVGVMLICVLSEVARLVFLCFGFSPLICLHVFDPMFELGFHFG